jgi:hypothetical protein
LSTILKALKRVDRTTAPPEDLQSWPPRIDTKQTLKTRIYKTWLHRKLYMSLILVLAVIAAGWFAYSQRHRLISMLHPGKSAGKVPIYQAKIYPNPGVSAGSAKKSATASDRPDARIKPNAARAPAGVDLSSRSLPQVPQPQKNQKIQIPASSNPTRPSGPTSTAKPEISRTPIPGSQKADQINPLQPAAVGTPKTQALPPQVSRSYRRLDDDKIKLQAIAWSNVAAQRIAVINGHVVREGESVEGFSVNQIRREDVIVSDGTESWQLEFRLK